MARTGGANGRLEQVRAGNDWDAHSLVGSFFRMPKGGGQGCVVAEPVPGTYLCELSSGPQHLAAIADMAGWEFYDETADATP